MMSKKTFSAIRGVRIVVVSFALLLALAVL